MATATVDRMGLDDLVPGLGELVEALREETKADKELLALLESRQAMKGGEDKTAKIMAEALGGIQTRLEQERAEIARKEGVLRRFGMDPRASREAGKPVAEPDAPADEKPARTPAKVHAPKKDKLTKADVLACVPEKGTISGPTLCKKVTENGFPGETNETIYGHLFELVGDGSVTRTGPEGNKVFRRA